MIEINNIKFEVEITHKKIKNLYMRLDSNKLIVSAPLSMPEYKIYNFIETRRKWIINTYNFNQYKKLTSNKYSGGNTFYIFDEKYNLIFNESSRSSYKIIGLNIYLNSKDLDSGINYLYKALNNKLLIKANEYLDFFMYLLESYGYSNKPVLVAKKMSSKWGVCYTRNNKIAISSYLIHYPDYCLKAIIIHEIVHFIVPNHSKRFYEIISNNYKDYDKAIDRLKV